MNARAELFSQSSGSSCSVAISAAWSATVVSGWKTASMLTVTRRRPNDKAIAAPPTR